MTFENITFKTFKKNLGKFLSYFLCCSFCISILFMYSTIILNKSVIKTINNFGREGLGIKNMLYISLIVLILFSTLFLSYSHSAFFNYRKKDLELYLILGMTKLDIRKLILLENSLIGLSALSIGLITGTVFGRLFFIIFAKILNLNTVSFILTYKNYLLTIVIFILIFIIIFVLNKLTVSKINICNLINYKKPLNSADAVYSYFSIAGLLIIIFSYIILYFSKTNKIILSTSLCFFGVYLLITNLGMLILDLSKKSKKFYHKHLLLLTEMNSKYNQNNKIIFTLCILCCITIYFIGLSYASYMETAKDATAQNPYDLVYTQAPNSKLPTGIINNNEIISKKTLKFITLNIQNKGSTINVLSEKEFNKFTHKNIHLNSGSCVTITLSETPEKSPWFKYKIKLLGAGNTSYEFTYSYEIWEVIIDIMNSNKHMLIINNADYSNLLKSNSQKTYYALKLKNWINGKIYADKLNTLGSSFNAVSKFDSYNNLKEQNLFFMFIMSFIGILFFISCGCILSFKLFTELNASILTCNKLHGLGITTLELKKLIRSQLKFIFFIPSSLGGLLAFAYILLQISKTYFKEDLFFHSICIIIIYFIFQIIFYYITQRKYLQLLKKAS